MRQTAPWILYLIGQSASVCGLIHRSADPVVQILSGERSQSFIYALYMYASHLLLSTYMTIYMLYDLLSRVRLRKIKDRGSGKDKSGKRKGF